VRTAVPTIHVQPGITNAYEGSVVWAPAKSLWVTGMYSVALVGGYLTASIENFLVFLVTTATTLCLGHSLGMHRRLIHQSYQCPKWLEYLFVHFGVVVGLAGPFGMSQTHDTRDWAQRQPQCHPYFSHGSNFLRDGLWQLHYDIRLANPPRFIPEPILGDSQLYRFMERTWMLQQLPLAVLLWSFGGVGWLVWGVAVRVAVSVTGHWLIGYFAHNRGHRSWHVQGASVQGYNVSFCGLITFGECWHNNHHAFPGSAKLGLERNQADPGWWVLCLLQRLGLVWDVKLSTDLPPRRDLAQIGAVTKVQRGIQTDGPASGGSAG
jgi:stearoyl-CoA desaturase (delta-9 desaturase)